MRIDSAGTGPQFKSNVKLISRDNTGLFSTKIFKTLVNRLANNGETDTVVFTETQCSRYTWQEQFFKDKDGKISTYRGPRKETYYRFPKGTYKGNNEEVLVRSEVDLLAPINRHATQKLDIYVVKEINGVPHVAASSAPQDRDIDYAEFRYRCAESNLSDHPIPDWVDKRLYKYIAPTSDSRVMLMYDEHYTRMGLNDLYKNEDFINFMEWLDKDFIKKEKDAQIIIEPNSVLRCKSKNYYIGMCMIKPEQSITGEERLHQRRGNVVWDPNCHLPHGSLKELALLNFSDPIYNTWFPNLLK